MRVQDPPRPPEVSLQPAQTQRWHQRPVLLLVAFFTAAAVIGLALLVFALGFLFVARSSSTSTAPIVDFANEPSDSRGYDYFGSLELAQGSSINLTVDSIATVDEIVLISAPEGLDVRLFEDANGVQVDISVPDNQPTGPQVLLFDIAGEPELISWEFLITSR